MTPEEQKMIDELKRLNVEATAVPWEIQRRDGQTDISTPKGSIMCDEEYYPSVPDNPKDWDLIAAMRNALPILLEEVEKGPKWIPVTQELPPDETPVLVVCKGIVRIGERRWEHPTFEESYQPFWYWDDPHDDGKDWENADITHWMLLPAPPALLPPAPASYDAREG